MSKRHAIKTPRLPSAEEPLAELLARKEREFIRRARRKAAETWRPIEVPERQGRPFGIAFFGDIHADDPDCNIPLLKRDIRLCAKTDGLYAVHLGDATNNWVGRLQRLYADQSTTLKDARRLTEWLLHDSGVTWLWWLLGNHDAWEQGDAILGLLAANCVYLPFWEAKIEVRAGREKWRVHTRHDFAGHSDWNKTHGLLKAAYKSTDAELLVCGHRHDWGTQAFEVSGLDRVVHVARARGYKWEDKYAVERGFAQSKRGATVLAIFNPKATDPAGRIIVTADLEQGARLLSLMRG